MRIELGRCGERAAAEFLCAKGYTVVAQNWRCRHGEVDLVCRDPTDVMVFVEVKTRRGLGFGEPVEAVTRRKLHRMRLVAAEYLSQCSSFVADVRFDVVGVLWKPDGPLIEHVERVL